MDKIYIYINKKTVIPQAQEASSFSLEGEKENSKVYVEWLVKGLRF